MVLLRSDGKFFQTDVTNNQYVKKSRIIEDLTSVIISSYYFMLSIYASYSLRSNAIKVLLRRRRIDVDDIA